MTNPYRDQPEPGPIRPRPEAVTPDPSVRAGSGFSLSEIRKTIVTALGMVVTIGGFVAPYVTSLSPQVGNTIGAVVGVATIVVNYLAPNETADPIRSVGRSVRIKGVKPVDDVGQHAA